MWTVISRFKTLHFENKKESGKEIGKGEKKRGKEGDKKGGERQREMGEERERDEEEGKNKLSEA